MKKVVLNYLLIAALVVSAAFQFGCSKKAETSNETEYVYYFGNKIPVAIVPKEKLPEFLIDRVDFYLGMFGENPIKGLGVGVYKGEWNKRTVYHVLPFLDNCMFCQVYNSDGSIIDWSNRDDFEDFSSKSKNWVLIYKIGKDFGDE